MALRSQRGFQIALLAAAGLLVVLVAGGVSISRWKPVAAPAPGEASGASATDAAAPPSLP